MNYNISKWLSALAYQQFSASLFTPDTPVGVRPYATEIEDILSKKIGASAVFCVEQTPVVSFFDMAQLEQTGDLQRAIDEIRQKLWNQNLLSVVMVVGNENLEAYSILDKEIASQRLNFEQASFADMWSAADFQMNHIQERLPLWFSPEKRVDRKLLKNLECTVEHLCKYGIEEITAKFLITQVIFTSYLEHRGIIGTEYRDRHNLQDLYSLTRTYDSEGVDQLLWQLGKDFNGDFLDAHYGKLQSWKQLPTEAFEIINDFLSNVDIKAGQLNLWKYDFSYIPVELISGIYEVFLLEKQKTLGAYYTPRHLATLVIEEAFKGLDNIIEQTVYDGACGSGILLTTAFRKMLRSAEVVSGRKLRLKERIDLLSQNIYGSDVDESACQVTAFSLYLSLLEGLDPPDISELQNNENVTLPPLMGKNPNILRGKPYGDFFSKDNDFASLKQFSVFLSNPPWREPKKNEQMSYEDWNSQLTCPLPFPHRQSAAAFAYRAVDCVKDDGRITLILPIKLFTSKTSKNFIERWLEMVRIERIINFSDIRRLLFPTSVHPCAVVTAIPRTKSSAGETIEYWTPKSDMSLALGRIALHACDCKTIFTAQVLSDNTILQTLYWGNDRDISLLQRLKRFGTLKKHIEKYSWLKAKGFHAEDRSHEAIVPPSGIRKIKFIPAKNLQLDYPLIKETDTLLIDFPEKFKSIANIGGEDGELYNYPRVLFLDGTSPEFEVRAVFSDFPFSFQSSVGAIGGKKSEPMLLKFLSIYLRSKLASYILLLTGYPLTGERSRVSMEQIADLPFFSPEEHSNPKVAHNIIEQIEHAFDEMNEIPASLRGAYFHEHRERFNELIMDYFELRENERIRVNDMVNFIAPSIQPTTYQNMRTPILLPPQSEELAQYCNTLKSSLLEWRNLRGGHGELNLDITIDDATNFLGFVRLRLVSERSDNIELHKVKNVFSNFLTEILKSIPDYLREVSPETIVLVPNLLVTAGKTIYIVKPMRRRFWLKSAALEDADRIVSNISMAAKAKGRF